MMHRCSSSQGNMVGPCSCGLFHHHHRSQSNSSSFSMLFSMPNSHKPFDHHHHQYQYHYEPDHHHHQQMYSSSSVDCTLSLGTPSTRLCSEVDVVDNKRRSDSYVSNFCWDLLQSKHSSASSSSSSSQTTSHKNSNGRGGNSTSGNNNNSDPLLARRCANCDTTSTPLWRNGPRGPKSLCNACGIRFKKEERRASAAAAAANGPGSGVVIEPSPMFSGNQYHNNNYPWNNFSHSQTTQKMPCSSPANEFGFMDDQYDDYQHESDNTGISFLSWRLNVTDRPSLVHDFTR